MLPEDVDEIELPQLMVAEDLGSGSAGYAPAGTSVSLRIAPGEQPLPDFGKRYTVLAKIGEGSMGSVFNVLAVSRRLLVPTVCKWCSNI